MKNLFLRMTKAVFNALDRTADRLLYTGANTTKVKSKVARDAIKVAGRTVGLLATGVGKLGQSVINSMGSHQRQVASEKDFERGAGSKTKPTVDNSTSNVHPVAHPAQASDKDAKDDPKGYFADQEKSNDIYGNAINPEDPEPLDYFNLGEIVAKVPDVKSKVMLNDKLAKITYEIDDLDVTLDVTMQDIKLDGKVLYDFSRGKDDEDYSHLISEVGIQNAYSTYRLIDMITFLNAAQKDYDDKVTSGYYDQFDVAEE